MWEKSVLYQNLLSVYGEEDAEKECEKLFVEFGGVFTIKKQYYHME